MFKKVVALYIVIVMLSLNVFVVAADELDAQEVFYANEYDAVEVTKIEGGTDIFKLKAKSGLLMDASTGNLIVESNIHEKLPIASVTKVMTILLIMDAIDGGKLSFDEKVTASEHACSMGGTQVWLEPGEIFTVKELLEAVVIRSANDCAVALAEKVAGTEEAFVALMNEKAKDLGMNDSNFLDCTGLTDEGHYSSAYDIAVMSRELIINHPRIFDFTTIWLKNFRENVPGKDPVMLSNTNKLIHYYEGANGLKTGFTQKAGFCLSATAKRNNLQLIAVVLGEPDSNTRFAEVRKLLDYGFANFETMKVDIKGDVVQEVEVKKGLDAKVKAIFSADVELIFKKGEKGKIEKSLKVGESIAAPVKAGQKLGEVIYMINGNEVGKADVVAECDVEAASFFKLFVRMIGKWFGLGR